MSATPAAPLAGRPAAEHDDGLLGELARLSLEGGQNGPERDGGRPLDVVVIDAEFVAIPLEDRRGIRRPEILEMQQAGFSRQDIQARENELRQQAISSTRQALKEHFVLDKIATTENLMVDPSEIDMEDDHRTVYRYSSYRAQ